MDDLSNSLPAIFGCAVVITILCVYNFAGWHWKARPWIPLILGTGLLLGGFALDVVLSNNISKIRDHSEISSNPTQVDAPLVHRTLSEIANGQERQIKLLELVTIPLAVALISTALFARADREFSAKVTAYSKRCKELLHLERDLGSIEAQLVNELTTGLRGRELLNRWENLRATRNRLLDRRMDVLDDFENLIESELVPPPEKSSSIDGDHR